MMKDKEKPGFYSVPLVHTSGRYQSLKSTNPHKKKLALHFAKKRRRGVLLVTVQVR